MESELLHLAKLPNFFIDPKLKEPLTFSTEKNILPLPVPDLNRSLDLYLDSAFVHLSPSEFQKTNLLVEEFRHDVGLKLQARLQQRAANTDNWLSEWWEEFAYLRDRSPLMPGANMSGPYPFLYHYWTAKVNSQLFRATILIHLLSYSRQMIRKERFPVDRRADGTPLSMAQYKRVFNGSREPGIEKDRLLNFFQTEVENSTDENSHVMVISNGHLYQLEVLDKASQSVKSISELHLQLQRIEAMSHESSSFELPRLTALDRPSWAKAREHLCSLHAVNAQNLDIIDRAAFCLTLDGSSPNTPDEIMESSLRAGEGMVWADKSYSVVVYRNGITMVTSDHAQLDGMSMLTISYMLDVEIYKNKGFSDRETQNLDVSLQVPSPKELVFIADAFIIDQIKASRDAYEKASENIVAKLPRFRHWGRRLMKTFSVHPDTAVQLALQLAYFRLHNKPAPTYETATTRRFRYGRTETIRSCTLEAVNWCRAMLEPGVELEERLRLFNLAHTKHNELRKACEEGNGCDRHLLGLACIAITEQLPMPEIFKDPAWEKSGGNGKFVLSTSTLGYATVLGGVKPMIKDGYGCFYRIGLELIEMVVTTFKDSNETNCDKMIEVIDLSMKEILELLHASKISPKSKL